MLTQVQIRNFQSHDNSVLDLSPGINTLVGDSDCGKSAVMRAILWAITNSPQGDAHVSDWIKTPKGKVKAGEHCQVIIDSNPGHGMHSVCRERSDDFNGYKVYDGGDDCREFSALRTDVPIEVSQCFNLGPVNIQRQMDAPFLIASTPGEAARFINQLVNLTDIDEAQTEINSLSRSCSADLKAAQASLDRAEAQVNAMGWVDRLKELSQRLQDLHEAIVRAEGRVRYINSGADSLRKAQETIEGLAGVDRAEDSLSKATRIGAALGSTSGRYNRIVFSISQYLKEPVIGDLSGADRVLAQAAEVQQGCQRRAESLSWMDSTMKAVREAQAQADLDLEGIEVPLNRATRVARKIDTARFQVDSIRPMMDRYLEVEKALAVASGSLEELYQELDGAVCPVCGKPIEIHDLEHRP